MQDLTITPATKDDSAAIAQLFMLSSDGMAEYIWSQMAEPGEALEAVGARPYEREAGKAGRLPRSMTPSMICQSIVPLKRPGSTILSKPKKSRLRQEQPTYLTVATMILAGGPPSTKRDTGLSPG